MSFVPYQKKNLHIIVHKFDAPEDGLIRRSFRVFIKKARKEFTSYCNYDDEIKSEIESRIHIDRTNIFGELEDIVNNTLNVNKKDLVTA